MEETVKRGSGQSALGTEKIGKLIARFSVPAIISMLVTSLYNIVDQIFIGQGVGMLGNAATNVVFPLVTITLAVALLIGIGSASNFNLKMGAGAKEEAGHFIGNGIVLILIFGVGIMAASLVFLKPMLLAFGATEPVMPYAVAYGSIIAVGSPFIMFATTASHMIRADGNPKYAMICVVSGAIFNVIFDPIFIFGLNMGMEGAAWATILGQMLSAALAAVYFLKRFQSAPLGKKQLRLRGKYLPKIFSLGSASCFNQLSMMVVQVVMNNVVTYYGALSSYGSEIPLAVVGILSKVNILFIGFAIGIAQGCQPINGFNYGAKQYDRVKETYKKAAIIVLIIGLVFFLCFQLFPHQITGIFGEGSAEYFSFAERYMRIFMMMTLLNGLQPVTANFFTSIGKAKKGIFISLTRQIIFLIPLILILPMVMGIDGVVYAGPIADAASVALCVIFILREMKELTAKQREMTLRTT